MFYYLFKIILLLIILFISDLFVLYFCLTYYNHLFNLLFLHFSKNAFSFFLTVISFHFYFPSYVKQIVFLLDFLYFSFCLFFSLVRSFSSFCFSYFHFIVSFLNGYAFRFYATIFLPLKKFLLFFVLFFLGFFLFNSCKISLVFMFLSIFIGFL